MPHLPHPVRALAFALCTLMACGVAAQSRAEVSISSPADGETVHDNEGRVRVALAIRGVPADDAVALRALVDGRPHGPDQRATMFDLEDVDRGEHVLQVLLVDREGGVVAASRPVTFHLRRASVLHPRRTR